jgi:hypothetical protein
MVAWDWVIRLHRHFQSSAEKLRSSAPDWLGEQGASTSDEDAQQRITEGPAAIITEWRDLHQSIPQILDLAEPLCVIWLEGGEDATLQDAGLATAGASATVKSVEAAAKKVLAILRRLGAWLQSVAADWEWAEDRLKFHKRALLDRKERYPPDKTRLRAAQQKLGKMEEELDLLQLEIKHRARRGEDTAESEERCTALKEKLKREKLDAVIVKERARLYWLAQEYFPELLHVGSEWSKEVGLDSSQVTFMACRKGLFAEGRRLEDFKLLSQQTAGEQRLVFRVRDNKGREWALKQFSLADDNALRGFYR